MRQLGPGYLWWTNKPEFQWHGNPCTAEVFDQMEVTISRELGTDVIADKKFFADHWFVDWLIREVTKEEIDINWIDYPAC